MPPKKKEARLNIYLPKWLHTAFRKLVADKGISMTAWIVQSIERSVIAGGYGRPPNPYDSMSDLIGFHQETLQNSSLPWELKDRLAQYKKGDRLTQLDIVRIAATLNMEESILIDLYQNSLNESEKQKTVRIIGE